MEGVQQVMTDKQWEGMLLMVRSMGEKCKTQEEFLNLIDDILEGRINKKPKTAEKEE